MEREELLLLGDFYEYFSEKECNGAEYVQAWQVCFKKALHNRSYHPFMRDFLKEGFGKFLRFFDAGGKRCLGDVLGREVIEKRQREGGEGENGQRKPGQGTEILQEYLSCFDGEVRSYLEENSYLQEATKALLKQSAAGAALCSKTEYALCLGKRERCLAGVSRSLYCGDKRKLDGEKSEPRVLGSRPDQRDSRRDVHGTVEGRRR